MPEFYLNRDTQSGTLDPEIPYPATLKRKDGITSTFAASLDGAGSVVITDESEHWITVNGEPIFSADKQLLEVVNP